MMFLKRFLYPPMQDALVIVAPSAQAVIQVAPAGVPTVAPRGVLQPAMHPAVPTGPVVKEAVEPIVSRSVITRIAIMNVSLQPAKEAVLEEILVRVSVLPGVQRAPAETNVHPVQPAPAPVITQSVEITVQAVQAVLARVRQPAKMDVKMTVPTRVLQPVSMGVAQVSVLRTARILVEPPVHRDVH